MTENCEKIIYDNAFSVKFIYYWWIFVRNKFTFLDASASEIYSETITIMCVDVVSLYISLSKATPKVTNSPYVSFVVIYSNYI